MKGLTQEQLLERRKRNKKTLKIVGIALLAIFLLSRLAPNKEIPPNSLASTKDSALVRENAQKQRMKLDSVIEKIKNDKEIKTNRVEYTNDSTLKIFLAPVKSEITAAGFDNLYHIIDIGNVLEIEVYKKESIESTYGLRTQAAYDNFQKQYISSWNGSCKPVVEYIKEKMNDPGSFEHDKTFVSPLTNGNFEIKTVFRGKNAFGGKVLNSCIAEVTPNGTIISFKMDE